MDVFLCCFATIAFSFPLNIYTTVSSLPGEIASMSASGMRARVVRLKEVV